MKSHANVRNRRKEREDSSWKDMLQIYAKHREDHGDRPVSLKENRKLFNWIQHQRALEKNGSLRNDRKEQLIAAGFKFTNKQIPWNGMLQIYAKHREDHGDRPVSTKDNIKLFNWLQHQRYLERKGNLLCDRKEQLVSAGFEFTTIKDSDWSYMLQVYTKHREDHGDRPVSIKENAKLCHWLHNQKSFERMGNLRSDRKEQLLAAGLKFTKKKDSEWDGMLQMNASFDRQRHDKDGLTREPFPRLQSMGFQCCSDEQTIKKGNRLAPNVHGASNQPIAKQVDAVSDLTEGQSERTEHMPSTAMETLEEESMDVVHGQDNLPTKFCQGGDQVDAPCYVISVKPRNGSYVQTGAWI